MGKRMAYWFGFAAVAGAFGGLIAFGIQHAKTSVSNWRLLFIIEVGTMCRLRKMRADESLQGIPSVLLGVTALVLLPNRPESTSFFNEEERKIALVRMNRGISGDTGLVVNRGWL